MLCYIINITEPQKNMLYFIFAYAFFYYIYSYKPCFSQWTMNIIFILLIIIIFDTMCVFCILHYEISNKFINCESHDLNDLSCPDINDLKLVIEINSDDSCGRTNGIFIKKS